MRRHIVFDPSGTAALLRLSSLSATTTASRGFSSVCSVCSGTGKYLTATSKRGVCPNHRKWLANQRDGKAEFNGCKHLYEVDRCSDPRKIEGQREVYATVSGLIQTNSMKSIKKRVDTSFFDNVDQVAVTTRLRCTTHKGGRFVACFFFAMLGSLLLGCQTLPTARSVPSNAKLEVVGQNDPAQVSAEPIGDASRDEPLEVAVSAESDLYPQQDLSVHAEVSSPNLKNHDPPPEISFDPEISFHSESGIAPADFLQSASLTPQKFKPVNSVTVVAVQPMDHPRSNLDQSSSTKDQTINDQAIDLLQRLEVLATNNHPRVQAIEHQIRALRHRIPQVEALPDPTFNNVFWPNQQQALQTAAGRVGNQMTLNQKVPWPEKLRAKSALAEKEVQIKTAELEQLKHDLTKQVKVAYYEFCLHTESSRILAKTQQGLIDLLPIVEARVRSGGSQQDLLRAKIAIDQIQQQIATSHEQQQIAKSKLCELTGESDIQSSGKTGSPSHDMLTSEFESLIETAERLNPELQVLEYKHQKAKANVQLADLERYPDLQFGVHWGLVSDDREVLSGIANGHDMFSFNVGTTLPIWQHKNRSVIREAKHLASSATSHLDSQRSTILNEMRALRATAESLMQRRSLYTDGILPKLKETLKISLADYRGKRIDFTELTSVYLEQLMIETEVLRIDARLGQTIAKIERAVGSSNIE
ncbi:MAG: TolC family protein [Rubripirellula sp.]|nr:TolC family protein [Rubripirellula sp.]